MWYVDINLYMRNAAFWPIEKDVVGFNDVVYLYASFMIEKRKQVS